MSTRLFRRSPIAVSVVIVSALALLLALSASPAFGGGEQGGGQSLERAIAAQERHTDALLAREGVVGTAVGLNPAGKPVVRVFTEREGVRGIPSSLDGVPVVVQNTGPFVAEDHAEGEFLRPVPIGVSSSNEFSINFPFISSGTLGARLVDDKGTATTDDDDYFAISNNHVFANENGSSGAGIPSPVIQPGRADGGSAPTDTIGTLFAYVPIEFNRRASNLVDVAIAVIETDGEGVLLVGTATPGDGYGEPSTDNLECVGNCSNLLGTLVKKYGRTTELTHGKITGVNAITIIRYDSGQAKFVHQLVIDPVAPTSDVSAGGDSGSLWVTEVGEDPVGLHFAGGGSVGIANRIDLVFDELANAINDDSTVEGMPVTAYISVDGKAPAPVDNPPTAIITAPGNDTSVSGTTVSITANVTDDNGVTSVTFRIDSGAETPMTLSGSNTNGTWTALWNSTSATEGLHTVTVTATDGVGQTGTDNVSVTVDNGGVGAGTGTVQGRVTNAATGQKISGATVTVVSTSDSDTTNNGGKYSLADVPAGLQDITAFATDCTSQTVSVDVIADNTVKQNFALVCPD